MFRSATAGTFLVLATTMSAAAHDYWLQPQRFFLSSGEPVDVQLFVGDHFVSEVERPFQAKKTVDFRLISWNKTFDLTTTAQDGKTPVATIAPQRTGNHLIVMERDWSHIEIEAAKFNSYLEHEGLGDILEARRKAGEEMSVGRERYRRYLKSLVQVGEKPDGTFKRRIGHRLEILAHDNPYDRRNEQISVSVLFDREPLRDAQVAAYNRDGDNTKTQEARTNDKGQVRIKLDRKGLWLIRLVHMQRCEDDQEFDWESFWAAYSFQLK